jgi:hypothetical protein
LEWDWIPVKGRLRDSVFIAKAYRPALGLTQPFIQWIPSAPSPRIEWSGREAEHFSPSSAENKSAWNYTSAPLYVLMAWCLVKLSDLYLYKSDNNFFPILMITNITTVPVLDVNISGKYNTVVISASENFTYR